MTMSTPGPYSLGKTIVIKGDLRADESVVIEGRVEGSVVCARDSVVLAASGQVKGDVIANDISVFGRFHGKLVAVDYVDLRPGSRGTGQILSKRFILDEEADFRGRVEPQHLEAALRVAEFQQKKREAS
jgi:cytoskeletal protein CcmA (bactofilin family)